MGIKHQVVEVRPAQLGWGQGKSWAGKVPPESRGWMHVARAGKSGSERSLGTGSDDPMLEVKGLVYRANISPPPPPPALRKEKDGAFLDHSDGHLVCAKLCAKCWGSKDK